MGYQFSGYLHISSVGLIFFTKTRVGTCWGGAASQIATRTGTSQIPSPPIFGGCGPLGTRRGQAGNGFDAFSAIPGHRAQGGHRRGTDSTKFRRLQFIGPKADKSREWIRHSFGGSTSSGSPRAQAGNGFDKASAVPGHRAQNGHKPGANSTKARQIQAIRHKASTNQERIRPNFGGCV